MTVREHVQQFSLGAEITLYEIDLQDFGLGIIRLAPYTDGQNDIISFGGNQFFPHPIKAEGFEANATGSLPRPHVTIANLDGSFTTLVEQNDDLHGGGLTRIRTYERYLDNGVEPDGGQHLPLDLYLLSHKIEHTNEQISWECRASIDQENSFLPGRVMIQSYCNHETRRWDSNSSTFDYSGATCPYVGSPKDIDGNDTTPDAEVFSKRLGTCCKARFGANGILPTRAFPGVARLKAR